MRLYRDVAPAMLFASVLALAILLTVLGCREDDESPTAPAPGPALAISATQALAFYQVSAGDDYTCGVTTDNRAYCWGWNGQGQLGDGTKTEHLTPFPVAGTLRCWGLGSDGELGDGTATGRLTPVPVAGGRQFRQVDAGQYHTCGVSYPDNRAYCWGYNGSDALGDGTSISRSTPVAVSGGRQFHQVDAGQFHTCGVTPLNKAYCWGWRAMGRESCPVYRGRSPAD